MQVYRTVPSQPQSHVRKMASKFRCDVCLKEFDYKYRYERHVETTLHKDTVRLMEICASTENFESEWESGNVNTGGSSTLTERHSPSAIAIATNYH